MSGVDRAAEEARRREQEGHTGWWVTGEGDVVLVRYDPVIRRFLLDGRVWPEADVLARYLRFRERQDGPEGWRALGDDATCRVREWLGLSEP